MQLFLILLLFTAASCLKESLNAHQNQSHLENHNETTLMSDHFPDFSNHSQMNASKDSMVVQTLEISTMAALINHSNSSTVTTLDTMSTAEISDTHNSSDASSTKRTVTSTITVSTSALSSQVATESPPTVDKTPSQPVVITNGSLDNVTTTDYLPNVTTTSQQQNVTVTGPQMNVTITNQPQTVTTTIQQQNVTTTSPQKNVTVTNSPQDVTNSSLQTVTTTSLNTTTKTAVPATSVRLSTANDKATTTTPLKPKTSIKPTTVSAISSTESKITTSPNTLSTAQSSTTSSSLHQFKYVFYGAGHNWTQPCLKMCLYCKGELKPSVSSCITVENIQQKPDEDVITWNISGLYQKSCQAVSFFWAAQWQLDDHNWGYKVNSTIVKGWKETVTQYFSPSEFKCTNGVLHIYTNWESHNKLNITCNQGTSSTAPFTNTTSSATASLKTKTTKPPVSVRWTTLPSKSTQAAFRSYNYNFGEGPIIAVVVCSCIIIMVIIAATVCAVKSFKRRRRGTFQSSGYRDDDTSIAFDNILPGGKGYNRGRTDSRSLLYSSDLDEDEEETMYQPRMFTFREPENPYRNQPTTEENVERPGYRNKPFLRRSSVQLSPLNQALDYSEG
ncbi:hypothetical protein EB796_012357 [Bugula neritina]|uniref:Uncharacterized protein n=1 Tax=Bugula neritina TaxID=10212 RepID=A0A7J7JSL8_BUGNE|nr:hypothetical protein EB796_012357 [Bugula neritina]